MNENSNVNRRKVLKFIGASGALGTSVGPVSADSSRSNNPTSKQHPTLSHNLGVINNSSDGRVIMLEIMSKGEEGVLHQRKFYLPGANDNNVDISKSSYFGDIDVPGEGIHLLRAYTDDNQRDEKAIYLTEGGMPDVADINIYVQFNGNLTINSGVA